MSRVLSGGDGIDKVTSRFMRLCLQSRWDPEALEVARALAAREGIDWNGLFTGACVQGLAPLLHLATRGQDLLPPEIEQRLRRVYFRSARRNVLLLHSLEDVLRRLEAEGVPAILLKGAALVEGVYGNPALRSMGDVDLLVHERDVPAVLRTLTSQGHEIVRPLAYRNEVGLRKPGEIILIEIHWNLFVDFYHQHALSMEWFWGTKSSTCVGETSARILSPEAQILHLCGHLLLHHGDGSELNPLWLYDVAVVAAAYAEQLNWEEVLARAGAYSLVLPLQQILSLVSEKWEGAIPPAVLERVRAMHPSRDEERVFGHIIAGHRTAERRFWVDLVSVPGWRARLRTIWRNLFPPAGYMIQIYGVPRRFLVVLYYPYRWLLGLWSGVTGRDLEGG